MKRWKRAWFTFWLIILALAVSAMRFCEASIAS